MAPIYEEGSSGESEDHVGTTQLAEGGALVFTAKLVGTGLRYVAQIFMASYLGAAVVGIYSIAMACAQLLEIFAGAGLATGSVRFVAIYRQRRDLARLKGVLLTAIRVPVVGGTILGLGLFFSAEFLAIHVFDEQGLASVLRIFSIVIPVSAAMNVLGSASTGFQRAKYYAMTDQVVQPSSNLLLLLALATLGFGANGAACAWLFATVMGLVFIISAIRTLFPQLLDANQPAEFETSRLLSFSLPLLSGSFLWLAIIWTDILMLGYFSTASEVGIYRIASQTALLGAIVSSSLETMFGAKMADLIAADETEKASKIYRTATRWSFTVSLPIILILAFGADDFLRIFGEEFVAGATVLIVLAVGQLVNSGTGGAGVVLIMTGHQIEKMIGDIVLAAVNVVLNIVLIPRYGILGAAVATSFSTAAINIFRLFQVYYYVKLQPYDRKYLKPLIAASAAAIGCVALQQLVLDVHFLISLFTTMAAIGFPYVVFLLLLKLDDSDKAALARMFAVVRAG